jgi:hypothetical protein
MEISSQFLPNKKIKLFSYEILILKNATGIYIQGNNK